MFPSSMFERIGQKPGPRPNDPDFVEIEQAGENEQEYRMGLEMLEIARQQLVGGASRETNNKKMLTEFAEINAILNELRKRCERLGPKVWPSW